MEILQQIATYYLVIGLIVFMISLALDKVRAKTILGAGGLMIAIAVIIGAITWPITVKKMYLYYSKQYKAKTRTAKKERAKK